MLLIFDAFSLIWPATNRKIWWLC